MFYSVDILRTSSPGDRTLRSLWRTTPKRQVGGQDIQEFLQQRPGSQNIKRWLLIKENQLSQVKEFSAFLCMERHKSLGSLKAFFWNAPQLSRASISCFLILSFLGCTVGGGCSSWFLDGAGPALILGSNRVHLLVAVMWWLDGCKFHCLLLWQAIFFIHKYIYFRLLQQYETFKFYIFTFRFKPTTTKMAKTYLNRWERRNTAWVR